MENPRNFIEKFRLEHYGIDTSGKQRPEFKSISKQLKNAIALLSKGLYEKEIHFVLELIQNAEDNEYRNSAPELEFQLLDQDPTGTPGSDGCLCVFNNELGFTSDHVESICQIGASTKSKMAGYIGEKGIGFKSVFLASERPHIFSNGFQFCFKEHDPEIELAYIVPYWIEQPPDLVRSKKAGTSILLPLKKGKKVEIDRDLSRIAPETILFLSKLQGISLDLLSTGRLELIRDHTDEHEVDLLVTRNGKDRASSRFWLFNQTNDVPSEINEEKRQGVTDRTVTVAFPLDESGSRGQIFAYLPTEVNSGLPFLVNGDFILSASRETIQTEKQWNCWIRNCITETVIAGIEALATHNEHKTQALSFLPLRSQLTAVQEFLNPLCDGVVGDLRQKEIVFSDFGQLVLPATARLASKNVRALFRPDNRPPAFFDGVCFCHRALESLPDQLKTLGVKSFSDTDLKQCASDEQWLQAQPVSWFSGFLKYVSSRPKTKTRWIKGTPIIPTTDGRVVKPSDGVFLLANEAQRDTFQNTIRKAGLPPVSFIVPSVFDAVAKDPNKKAWLNEHLGIGPFSPSTYFGEVLFPWAAKNVLNLTAQKLLGICQLFLDSWEDLDDAALNRLGSELPVVLDDGSLVSRSEIRGLELLVPRAFDKKTGWQLFLLKSADFGHAAILSDAYLELEADDERLRSLMQRLDAQQYPDLKEHEFVKGRNHDPESEDYLTAQFEQAQRPWTNLPRIKTWMPPRFFFDNNLLRIKKHRQAFTAWLEGMIENRRDSLQSGVMTWFYYSQQRRSIPSGLYWQIANTPWINTTKGLKRPAEAFKPTREIKEIIGSTVPFIKDKLSNELCEFLGIQTEATTESIIAYLQALSGNNDVDLRTLKRLYKHLDRYADEIFETFAEHALTFVPDTPQGWYKSSEVVWQNLSDVFGGVYIGLSSTYDADNLSRFFRKKLHVSDTVGTKELADAWLRMCDDENPDTEHVEKSLTKIIPELLREASKEGDKADWWEDFVTEVQVWTLDRLFIEPSIVFAGDDDFLRRKLEDQTHFVWKPDSRSHKEMRPLYQQLEIRPVSEAVSLSLTSPSHIRPITPPAILTGLSKRLLCYLVFDQSADEFSSQLDSGALHTILRAHEFQAASLDVVYKIADVRVNISDTDRVAFFDPDDGALFLREGADEDDCLDEASEGISRALWGRSWKKLNDSVRAILSVKSDRRYRTQRDKRGWHMPKEFMRDIDALINDLRPEPPKAGDTDGRKEEPSKSARPSTGKNSGEVDRGQAGTRSNGDEGSSGDASDAPDDEYSASSTQATGHVSESKKAPRRSTRRRDSGIYPPTTGRSKSQKVNRQIERDRQNRIVTYVHQNDEKFESSDQEQLERRRQNRELGDTAERFVVQAEIEDGRNAEQMARNYPGYDVKSTDPNTGEIRFIEVKAVRERWGARGVGLSATQYSKARERRSAYWLYVVENAGSNKPTIHRICNPAEKVTEYRFDQNWKQLAGSERAHFRAEAPEFSTLLEELKSLTDDSECQQIIDLCEKHDLPMPEVGYELMSDTEVVIAEAELAWPIAGIAILLGEQDDYSADFDTHGWETYPPSVNNDDLIAALLEQGNSKSNEE